MSDRRRLEPVRPGPIGHPVIMTSCLPWTGGRPLWGGSTFSPASHRAITAAQIQDLAQLGAETEAESLQLFSVTGKVSKTTLL